MPCNTDNNTLNNKGLLKFIWKVRVYLRGIWLAVTNRIYVPSKWSNKWNDEKHSNRC